MKIFISWSGDRSKLVAELLSEWIQCVIQAVDPWLSSKDIDRGSLWFSEITNQLSSTQNGIVCLTKSNLNKPWILFESGALAKGLSSNRVYTFLIDLQPNEIKDPLAQFNHTTPTKEGLYQLVRTINNSLENLALKENILHSVFETYWPQFDKEFKQIIKNTKEEQEVVEDRPKEDILNEILLSVRNLNKRVRTIEELEAKNNISDSQLKARVSRSNFLDTPIEELNLSVRALNTLKIAQLGTLREYLSFDNNGLNKFSETLKEELREIIQQNIRRS